MFGAIEWKTGPPEGGFSRLLRLCSGPSGIALRKTEIGPADVTVVSVLFPENGGNLLARSLGRHAAERLRRAGVRRAVAPAGYGAWEALLKREIRPVDRSTLHTALLWSAVAYAARMMDIPLDALRLTVYASEPGKPLVRLAEQAERHACRARIVCRTGSEALPARFVNAEQDNEPMDIAVYYDEALLDEPVQTPRLAILPQGSLPPAHLLDTPSVNGLGMVIPAAIADVVSDQDTREALLAALQDGGRLHGEPIEVVGLTLHGIPIL